MSARDFPCCEPLNLGEVCGAVLAAVLEAVRTEGDPTANVEHEGRMFAPVWAYPVDLGTIADLNADPINDGVLSVIIEVDISDSGDAVTIAAWMPGSRVGTGEIALDAATWSQLAAAWEEVMFWPLADELAEIRYPETVAS